MSSEITPLILLPGAGGIDGKMEACARSCMQRIPTILLEYPDWCWQVEHLGFSALATEMTRRILAATPSNKLALAGYSIGGPLAAIVQTKLVRSGRDVIWMAAIDPYMPRSGDIGPLLMTRIRRSLALAYSSGLRSLALFFETHLARGIARLLAVRLETHYIHTGPILRFLAPVGSRLSREFNIRLMVRSGANWKHANARQNTNVPCVLLRTHGMVLDNKFWLSRFADVKVIDVSGDHHSVLEKAAPEALLQHWDCYVNGRQNPSAQSLRSF